MRRKNVVLYSIVLLVVLMVATATTIYATSTKPATTASAQPQDALSRINNSYITSTVFNKYLDRQVTRYKTAYGIDFYAEENKGQLVNLKKQTLEQLMKNELLLQACYELGIAISEEEIKEELGNIKANYADEDTFLKVLESVSYTMDELRGDIILQLSYNKLADNLVQNQKITEEEMQKFYQDNIRKFSVEEQVRASHILVDTKEQADSLLKELKKGAKFEEVAKNNSTCPSSAQGGDLGFFGRGAMVAEFENAAFALEIGKLSEPVQTQFGWHIIKVTEHKPAVVYKYEEVKETVSQTMLDQKKYTAANAYLDKKWNESSTEYYVNFTN